MSSTRHGLSQISVLQLRLERFTARDGTRYWPRIAISAYPTCIRPTPPLEGSRQNIATTFGIVKLEWCSYQMVKKIWRYDYLLWHNSWTWQTDGQTPIIGENSFRQSLKMFLFATYWCIQRIRGFTTMRYINWLLLTYLLTAWRHRPCLCMASRGKMAITTLKAVVKQLILKQTNELQWVYRKVF